MCRTDFLDFVERVLLLHDESDIKRFRLKVNVHVKAARVNSWISATIRHKVQELDLSLPLREQFVLPCYLFTCQSLVVLKLHMNSDLRVPTKICFSSLKSLWLSLVTFLDDNSAEQLFSSCPVLQDLNLTDCGWDNIKSITISFPTLKSLTICLPPRDEDHYFLDCEIKIYAANLISLNFMSSLIVDFLPYNLSSLVDASIDLIYGGVSEQEVGHHAVKLLNSTHNAESLKISFETFTALSFAENLPDCLSMFNSLTYFKVIFVISVDTTRDLMAILQKTPKLECLDIVNGCHFLIDEALMLESVPLCFQTHLKSVIFSEFDGNAAEIQLLELLLKNATVLERMIIHVDKLYADTKKQGDIRNQLQMLPRGSENCVIEGVKERRKEMEGKGYIQLPKCQKLSREQNGSEGEDIISKLPDGVIHHILSFLSTKDAIRTSILSSRWQYLWTSISSIDLVDNTRPWFRKKKENCAMCSSSFLDFVERVLLLHDADIKRFRLTVYGHFNATRINSWISATIRHKVQELDLSIPMGEQFVLPYCVFTSKSLAVLQLQMGCDLRVPTNICFSSLKRLQLSAVTFLDGNSTEQLFSSFPVLQELSLINCGWKNIKSITICIPTLNRLTVCSCPMFFEEDFLDCEIQIYAANLIYLNFTSNLTVDYLLYNLCSSVSASIDLANVRAGRQEVARRAVKLLNSMHNAKSLEISFDNFQVLSFAENLLDSLSMFDSLTVLEVEWEISVCTTRVLMTILQKSPKLISLNIVKGDLVFLVEDEDDQVDWMLVSVPRCFKSHLKTFSFSGFEETAVEMHFLSFLLKNATVLERMTICYSDDFSAEMRCGRRSSVSYKCFLEAQKIVTISLSAQFETESINSDNGEEKSKKTKKPLHLLFKETVEYTENFESDRETIELKKKLRKEDVRGLKENREGENLNKKPKKVYGGVKSESKPRSLYAVFGNNAANSEKSGDMEPLQEEEEPMAFKGLSPDMVLFVNFLYKEGYFNDASFLPRNKFDVSCLENSYGLNFIKFAAEKFGKDNQEIAKWLSGNDLKKVALFGCPSLARNDIFSAKRLRSFFRIQENIVCSKCVLRFSCKFANQNVWKSDTKNLNLAVVMRVITLASSGSHKVKSVTAQVML
ncbi:hypothetical protein F0562_010549 [Nyssa sinensis]|uniref:F-box domain-containing protein n=1 Tax=Nyssa sinensis TaxID=561372 RepID=A0A5J5A0L8_9ASTE|nr:hypothetical protein F0562_010549 [Nyssa sinensis]